MILENTVFGGLLQECDDDSLAQVTFSANSMMLEILEHLGVARGKGHESLRRLLSSVAAFHEKGVGEDGSSQGDAMVVA